MSEKAIRSASSVEAALTDDVDVLLGTFFLAAVVLHACVAFLVVSARPRPRAWWLLLLLVTLSGGSAFARAWWAFAPDAGADGWFHRVSVDLEWPLSFVVLGIAWYAKGTPPPRRWQATAIVIIGAAWILVILRKDLFYGEPLPGYPIETDYRAFLTDRLRYYVTIGAALLVLGAAWVRNPSTERTSAILFVGFAFGPLQAAPELWRRGFGGDNATAYDLVSNALQIAGPLSTFLICLVVVLIAFRREGRASRWVATWLLAALASGALSVLLTQVFEVGTLPGFGEVGYLIVRPALLAYGFASYGFGDGPVQVPSGLITTTVTVLAALAFLPIEEIVRRFAPVSPELALPLGIATGLAASATCFLTVAGVMRDSGQVRPRLLGARYRIVRELGRGASGSTFECIDQREDAQVAVKVIQTHDEPAIRERAVREADLHASLLDPHLVRVRETLVLPAEVLIVMELAHGGSLATKLRTADQPIRGDEAAALLRDVLAGLHALHAAGIAHGDLKPSNVLLAHDGRAMLSDFGIAKRTEAATLTGLAGAGTPAYMAPEVLLGAAPNVRADVFATGILLYECLMGRPPQREWTSAGVESPELGSASLPRWAKAYVRYTTAPVSASRPKDAAEALSFLEECLSALAEEKQASPDPDHIARDQFR